MTPILVVGNDVVLTNLENVVEREFWRDPL